MNSSIRGILVIAVTLIASIRMQAADYFWNSPSSSEFWEDQNNWTPRGIPGSDDNAYAENGQTIRVRSGNHLVNELRIGGLTQPGKLFVSGNAALITNSNIYVSFAQNSATNITLSDNASFHSNESINIVSMQNSSAVISLGEQSSFSANSILSIGAENNSLANITLTDKARISAGVISIARGYLGSTSSTNANVSLSGESTISSSGGLMIAYSGNSSANIVLSGESRITAKQDMYIAQHDNATANVTLNDDSSISSERTVSVAGNGNTSANVVLRGNSSIISNQSYVAFSTGENSSVNVTLHDNSSIHSPDTINIGAGSNSSTNITLHPEASISTDALQAWGRSKFHFIISPESSGTAPIQVTSMSVSRASISVEFTSMPDHSIIPLIQTDQRYPLSSLPTLVETSIPGHLEWFSNNGTLAIVITLPEAPPTSVSVTRSIDRLEPDGSLTLTAEANGFPIPSYQWQVSTDNGISWQDVANGLHYSGATRNALGISNTTKEMLYYQFRVVATNPSGSATSDPVFTSVSSTSHYWNSGNGDWFDSAKWNPAGPPLGNSDAYIQGSSAVSLSEAKVFVRNLTTSGTPSLSLPGSGSIHANMITMGSTNASVTGLHLSGNGSLITDSHFHIGDSPDSVSNVSLLGNASISSHRALRIGFQNATSNTTLSDNARISAASMLRIAYQDATANITLSNNASLSSDGLYIAYRGQSSANITLRNQSGIFVGTTDGATFAYMNNASAEVALHDQSYITGSFLRFAYMNNASANVTLHDQSSISASSLTLAYTNNASANVTLRDQSSISVKRLEMSQVDFNNTARIILHPRASLSTNALVSSARSKFHFIASPQSSLSVAPLQLIPSHPSNLIAPKGNITVDASAYPYTADIPLIRIDFNSGSQNDATYTVVSSYPGTSTSLEWVSDPGDAPYSTLYLKVVGSTPPPAITLLTDDHHLIYALTDTYTLHPETNTPLTNGDTSHHPRITHNLDGTLTLRFTPLREGYTYEVQHSTDLENWTTIETIDSPSSSEQSVSSPETHKDEPRQFLRLKITPQ